MTLSRRKFVGLAGVVATGLPVSGQGHSQAAPAPAVASPDPVLEVGDNIAVVETSHGKVRGYVLRGIYHFLGIPYGADTSGANRFMPPQGPKAWTDIYPALWWGNSAPQEMERRYGNPYTAFKNHWNYDDLSEDCLRINVFTPDASASKKRPVLFWLHGGGFTTGNAIEQDGYNGENLARDGDVVFCSVNHRLGPLGFSDFSGGDTRFRESGNVGMLDIVAALRWVRDNIERFGGDPGNVTIMGQSGGGAKVCLLTAMPSAEGLFHKAVVLSGASLKAGDKELSRRLGTYVLREAGLPASDVHKLQQLPWREYYGLATRAEQKLRSESGSQGQPLGFGPVMDGSVLLQHPYVPEPAPTAARVPLIICSTLNEMSPAWPDSAATKVSLDEVVERVRDRAGFGRGFGEQSKAVVEAYARAFPGLRPVDIWSLVISNRQSAVALADAKSKQPAPVFMSWFTWQPPLFDGRIGAFHCVDICFWFKNTDLMLTHTGGGARPRRLAEEMSSYLLQFMRTGDPNTSGRVRWPKYTSETGETLVFDDVLQVKDDPDRDARKALPPLV